MTTKLRRALNLALGGLLLVGAGVAGAVGSPSTTAGTTAAADGFAPGCIGYCKRPTNAAKVFRWGSEEWRREFEDRTTSRVQGAWRTNHPELVEQREGMLTIHATSATDHVTMEATDQSAEYGRWEARVRAVEESTGSARFSFVWELAPSGAAGCDDDGIVLAQYQPGDAQVQGEVRTAPDQAFRYSRTLDLRSRAWHTYAVEVTPTHISWFVDTRVIRTERRPAALSGATFHPEFEIVGQPGQRMDTSRMQMDWVRYYDLHRPNAHPITAPRMTQGTFAPSC
jgi:hypothetical protein